MLLDLLLGAKLDSYLLTLIVDMSIFDKYASEGIANTYT